MIDVYGLQVYTTRKFFNGERKNINGFYIRNITNVAAVDYNLATTTNPLTPGGYVNNRHAEQREVTLELGYDGSTPIETANNDLYAFLSPALTRKLEISLLKAKPNSTTYDYSTLSGYIKSIEQLVFTNEPVMQIVLLCNPYWAKTNTYSYDYFTVKNSKATHYLESGTSDALIGSPWRCKLTFNKHDTAESVNFVFSFYQIPGNTTGYFSKLEFTTSLPILEVSSIGDRAQYAEIELVYTLNSFKVIKTIHYNNGTSTDTDITESVSFPNGIIPLALADVSVYIGSTDLYTNKNRIQWNFYSEGWRIN